MTFNYRTQGTCSTMIQVETDGDRIAQVRFKDGCSGNLQGISLLLEGMKIEDAAKRLKGIKCGYKSTSCPDQLATALEDVLKRT